MAGSSVAATPVARHATGAAYDLPPDAGCGPHRVFVFVPAAAAPATGWPLLVTTDGNATFDLAVGMMRSQALDRTGSNVEDGIIVSVGYPTDGLYDQVGRCWDLSPPPGRRYPGPDGVIRTGGGAHFLDFVEARLLPWLATLAPIDPRRRTLFGHSFGGLFTLIALYRRPTLFSTYVAASPSLYWENQAIKQFEDAFFASVPADLEATILLSAGEWEGAELAPHLRGRDNEAALRDKLLAIAKVERVTALLRRLQSTDSPAVIASLEVFPRENHMSALVVALNRATQAAFGVAATAEDRDKDSAAV